MKNYKNSRRELAKSIAGQSDLGVSFSLISCGSTNYDVNWRDALKFTLDLGFKRFRLMSYWNLCEAEEGVYDFADLDEQLEIVKKAGGRVTLCIGINQPRWPEAHIPQWASKLPRDESVAKYLLFHAEVVNRYKDFDVVDSWQLENEFWLRSFGEHIDFDRSRLKKEFSIIRSINPQRPIIMSLSSVGSLPLREPTPDIYSTSIYRNIYSSERQGYTHTPVKPHVYRVKRRLIKLVKRRDLIVHELQAEPWGPKANWEMSKQQQFDSMNPEQVIAAVQYAKDTKISYMDLWGAEWWYWFTQKYNDESLKKSMQHLIQQNIKDS